MWRHSERRRDRSRRETWQEKPFMRSEKMFGSLIAVLARCDVKRTSSCSPAFRSYFLQIIADASNDFFLLSIEFHRKKGKRHQYMSFPLLSHALTVWAFFVFPRFQWGEKRLPFIVSIVCETLRDTSQSISAFYARRQPSLFIFLIPEIKWSFFEIFMSISYSHDLIRMTINNDNN